MRAYVSKGVFLVFFILLSVAVGGQPILAAEVPAAVQQAANAGLPAMLQAIPDDAIQQLNFSSSEEVSLAALGTPFQVFAIPPDEILNYDGATPIEEIIVETDHWLFPVTVNGEARTLLTVAEMAGQWQAVSIGSSGLAQEWKDSVRRYDVSMGYTHKLVRVYQATADFVLLGGAGGDKLLPLKGGRVALGLKEGAEPTDPAEIIFQLQGTVRENIEASQ